MNQLLSYATQYSNYTVINQSNLFNFIYMTMTCMSQDERLRYIETMKLIMGNTFTMSYRYYLFSKFPSSELLKLF